MSLSGRSCFSSKGEFNYKICLLLAWLVYWSQTFLVQNIKATQSSSVLDTTRGEQQRRAHMRQHSESSPEAFCSHTFIICASKSLSPVEFSNTSAQGSLYPLQLEESGKTDITDAGRSNFAGTVPLIWALN